MFVYGWTNFSYMREVPRDAMVIEVTGRQWAWSFRYPNGKQTTDLLLAADKPVKLELRSLDVIHGFFIPAFRIKEDVVPGKENFTWFAPIQLGSFDIECTAICGVSHAIMLSKAVVVPVADFEAWYFGSEEASLPGQAKKSVSATEQSGTAALKILNEKSCTTCHSIDGSPMVGPSLKALYGKRQVITDSSGKDHEATVDDAYLVKAIQTPSADTVKGYPPIMPNNPLNDSELKQVVDYIKTLR
jgi:cytochrome c oxidase subunit 2